MGPGEERNLLRMLRHTNRFSTLQMRAHVHVLEMRERAGAQRRQVPAVPGADRGGGPGIRGAVNYTTTVGSFGAGGSVAKPGRKREKQDPCFFFILLFVFLSFSVSSHVAFLCTILQDLHYIHIYQPPLCWAQAIGGACVRASCY